eukprot:TRINITY_DN17699_c0_g1_i2.p1 TRINITY_DN17699_c0_g1~~TRINITY_DN17699_c0_g1_i2.p1  ORF type:complete len:373 (+),score=8.41 TRINITY_DN17699_c0_g1_i2:89-1120(+)
MALAAVLVAAAAAWPLSRPDCTDCQAELTERCGDPTASGVAACRECTFDLHILLRACCSRMHVIRFCRSACTYARDSTCEEDKDECCDQPGYAPPACSSCLYGYEGPGCERCMVGYVGWPRCYPTECNLKVHCSDHADSVVPIHIHGQVFCICECRHLWAGCDCSLCPEHVDTEKDCAMCRYGFRGTAPTCTPEPECQAQQRECNERACTICRFVNKDSGEVLDRNGQRCPRAKTLTYASCVRRCTHLTSCLGRCMSWFGRRTSCFGRRASCLRRCATPGAAALSPATVTRPRRGPQSHVALGSAGAVACPPYGGAAGGAQRPHPRPAGAVIVGVIGGEGSWP